MASTGSIVTCQFIPGTALASNDDKQTCISLARQMASTTTKCKESPVKLKTKIMLKFLVKQFSVLFLHFIIIFIFSFFVNLFYAWVRCSQQHIFFFGRFEYGCDHLWVWLFAQRGICQVAPQKQMQYWVALILIFRACQANVSLLVQLQNRHHKEQCACILSCVHLMLRPWLF